MTSQGQTCVNTPILDTLAYPATCLESPVNDLTGFDPSPASHVRMLS
jgi:hypothetical protein